MIDSSVSTKTNTSDKKLVVKGVFWNGVQLVINQGFQFIIRLILAKLLLPEQFGVVGMATVFTGLVQVINDLGIGAALVQRKESALRPEHFHTAFWTGIIWSGGIYVILCFGVAPLAAYFYKEPILTSIIPVMSLGILVNPIVLVHQAQLTKSMDFKKITFIRNSTTIFSGVLALVLAFLGAGIWSLVFNSLAQIVLAVPLYFRATGWKPKWIWDKQAYKDVFGFGLYTTVTNIVNYLFNNVDYFLIGKMLSASLLGSYTLAFVLTDTFRSRLMAVMNNVMYPLYGKKQDDLQSLKKYYLKVVEYNSIVIYPIMMFFIIMGGPFVESFFGKKWQDTIEPLQILACSVMFHMMVNSNSALIRGLGKPQLEMRLQIVKSIIFIPSLAAGIFYYGIVGAAWAVLFNKIVAVIIAQFTFKYLIEIKVSTREFWGSIKLPVLASAISGIMAYFVMKIGLHYIVSALFMLLIYAGSLWLMADMEFKNQVKYLIKKGK